MKTIEIEIGGTGHEITRSKFTDEELTKVKEYCKENKKNVLSFIVRITWLIKKISELKSILLRNLNQ